MHVEQFEVENYRSIPSLTFELDNFNLLIGKTMLANQTSSNLYINIEIF